MRYRTGAFIIVSISMIVMLYLNGCETKNNTSEVEKSHHTASNNESIMKDNITVNDTVPKRYYKEDAAKVDTFPYFADYKGYRYYFPCGPCRDRFIQDREEYLEKWVKKGRRIRKRKL